MLYVYIVYVFFFFFFFRTTYLGSKFLYRGSGASDGRHRYGIADDDVVPWRQDGKGRLLQGTYKPNCLVALPKKHHSKRFCWMKMMDCSFFWWCLYTGTWTFQNLFLEHVLNLGQKIKIPVDLLEFVWLSPQIVKRGFPWVEKGQEYLQKANAWGRMVV